MSRLRIVVHVGMRKAASSTLQQLFLRNKDGLAARGMLYPSFQGRAYNHRLLNDRISRTAPMQEVTTFLNALETEIAESNANTVLFSYEGWAFGATAAGFFHDLAERWNAELQIVLVVRQPEEYLNSWYAHRVMDLRLSDPFPTVFRKEIGSRQMAYGSSFRHWSDLPGTRFVALPLNGVADVKSLMLDVLGYPSEQAAETGSFNKAGSAHEIEIFRRLHVRKSLAGLAGGAKAQQLAKAAAREICEEHGWPDAPFYGVTGDLARISEAKTLQSLDTFSRDTWGKPWKDVFPAAFAPSRPANMIDPGRIDTSLERDLEAAAVKIERSVQDSLA